MSVLRSAEDGHRQGRVLPLCGRTLLQSEQISETRCWAKRVGKVRWCLRAQDTALLEWWSNRTPGLGMGGDRVRKVQWIWGAGNAEEGRANAVSPASLWVLHLQIQQKLQMENILEKEILLEVQTLSYSLIIQCISTCTCWAPNTAHIYLLIHLFLYLLVCVWGGISCVEIRGLLVGVGSLALCGS